MVLKKQMREDKADFRIDYMPYSDDGPEGDWMVQPMVKQDNGFMKGRAIVTNVGVFPYLMDDGSVLRELRLAEEVFSPETIKTLDGLVCTDGHKGAVTAENAKDWGVGFASSPREDQYYCSDEITITDKEVIRSIIEDKKHALSCGYTCDVEMKSGNWLGVPYDAIQRNIRYNHLAVNIQAGRAGDAAKLKLDESDISRYKDLENNTVGIANINTADSKDAIGGEEENVMVKITIDGLTYEVADENAAKVIQAKLDALDTAMKERDDAKEALVKAEANADSATDEVVKLKKDMADLKKVDHSDAIQKGVSERMELIGAATKAGVELKGDETATDIQKSVILAVYPTAKEKLDEKADDAGYISARFDSAMDALENVNKNNTLQGDSVLETSTLKQDDKENRTEEKQDATSARKRMIANMQKASSKEAK